MVYHRIDYQKTRAFCIKVFQGYGFTENESTKVVSHPIHGGSVEYLVDMEQVQERLSAI